jgi:predicted flap endonuclease-1-like 5' DNA nuclease
MITMRSDYLFYLLAVVFFLIATTSIALVDDPTGKTLWATSAVILGLVSAGIGYYQRPKVKVAIATTSEVKPAELDDTHVKESPPAETVEKQSESIAEPVTTPSIPTQEVAPIQVPTPTPTPANVPTPVETPAPAVEAHPQAKSELMSIKGINEKRAAQLEALGINGIADLANASAEDLAKNLTISPKVTRMWIGSAKKLQKQTE